MKKMSFVIASPSRARAKQSKFGSKVVCFIARSSALLAMTLFMFGTAQAASAALVSPKTIPCVPSLPCIRETTQGSGQAVRDYILKDFATTFITGFMGFVAIAATIFIIVGGIQMHAALGNEEGIKRAKATITWSIVGLVIAILSVAIVQIVSNLFK